VTGVPVEQAPTFQLYFQQFMYYAGPIVQLLFWIAIAAAAIYAVILFKKFVQLKAIEVGVDAVVAADALEDKAETTAAADTKVSVDEFVE
jgi:hypothetical protein